MRKLSHQADEFYCAGKQEAARIKIIDGLELAAEVQNAPYYYFFQGELEYIEDHLIAATEHYRHACHLMPDNAFAMRGLAVTYSRRKIFHKAHGTFERALKKYPFDFRLWRQRGVTYSRTKNFAEALECFDKALEIAPQDYHSLRQKGVTFTKMEQHEEAIGLFNQALAINPEDFRALFEQSRTLTEMGLNAEAERRYQRSLEVFKSASQVPHRESLLARLKMRRIRKNQQRMLEKFQQSLRQA